MLAKRLVVLLAAVAVNVNAQEPAICLDQVEARNIATYIKRTEAENEALKVEIQKAPSPVLLITVSAVAGLLLGGSVVYGVTKLQKP